MPTIATPLSVLTADEAASISSFIDLALDGVMGWAPAIRTARSITEDAVAEGRITQAQADLVVDYTRSF